MSAEQIRELALISDQQIELCSKVLHAAEIVFDIYGEMMMTTVVEEVLESEKTKYSVEEVQNIYVTLLNHKMI